MAVAERLERRPILVASILLVIAFSCLAVMLQSGTGLAEGCPTGTPEPTNTDPPSPPPTETGLPSPSPSGTDLPSPPPTQSGLPTSLPSTGLPGAAHAPRAVGAGEGEDPTPTPDPCAASLSLTANPSAGVWGTQFALGGTLTCAAGGISAQTVTLHKKPYGATSWTAVGSDSTDSNGVFQFTAQQPAANTAYKAVFAGSTLCDAASSGASVLVRPGAAFNIAANGSPARGQYVSFGGRVLPAHPGQRVVLQVLQNGQWANAVAVTLNGNSEYRVGYKRNGTGMLLFRMAYPSQHGDHAWNVSRRIAVTWH